MDDSSENIKASIKKS